MTAIRVVRQGKKGKTDRLPLYVEFYINREKIRIAVRLSVTSKEWDEQNEVIKGRDKESKDKKFNHLQYPFTCKRHICPCPS